MREVARGVAERLGFALVDEEIILRAAAEGGVESDAVADVERRRSFMERALATAVSGSAGVTFAAGGLDSYYTGSVGSPQASEELRGFIRIAIEETAERGSVVIVAHAASHALASRPDVLRVLVTASSPIREARVASEQDLNEKDAARAVDTSDAARADYLKRFYGAKSELPTQYDLVVNTDRLSADKAVSLVAHAAAN
jgi:cytidylate kinase-like protein